MASIPTKLQALALAAGENENVVNFISKPTLLSTTWTSLP
jgi:hypothetical protein